MALLLGKDQISGYRWFLISKINCATDLGHTPDLNSESQLPDSVVGDQVATLITTLGNLIDAGGIRPEPGGEISVTLHYRHGWLHCEVNDDGLGIAPDKIDHIFDKGVSDKRKRARRRFSTCRKQQVVENLGGSIAGIGTRFSHNFLSRYPGTGRGRTG